MKTVLTFFKVVVLSTLLLSSASSLYFQENFADAVAASNNWNLYFPYGREGIIDGNISTSVIDIKDGQLNISGRPLNNDGSYSYHTVWLGRCAKLTNYNGQPTVSASATDPFGFQAIRTIGRIQYARNAGWPENAGGLAVWLIEEINIPESNWFTLNNFLFLYEGCKYPWGVSSQWGYFKGSERRIQLTNLLRPGGETTDLSFLEFDYNSAANINNTNIGLRISFNGSEVKFYLNPDPFDQNAYVNEYCLMASTTFDITNNLRIMLGHENNTADPTAQFYNASYTNLLMRSVSDASSFIILPALAKAGGKTIFTNTITSTFRETDAGIGEIKIIKSPTWGPWSDIRVLVGNETYAVVHDNARVGKNQVLASINGECLKLRFLQDKPLAGGAIKDTAADIKVVFGLQPSKAEALGKTSFRCYVDCVKYDYTGYADIATTGEKLVKPATKTADIVEIVGSPISLDR